MQGPGGFCGSGGPGFRVEGPAFPLVQLCLRGGSEGRGVLPGDSGGRSAPGGSCERWKVLQPVWAPSCHLLSIECISLASFLAVARWLDKASMAGKVSTGD